MIVTYNSAAEIGTCLDALDRLAPDMKQIVIDNASSDATVEKVSRRVRVQLIANKTNLGFAAAVNQGVRFSQGCSPILLLNPDAEILTPLGPIIEACNQHGLAAGQLADLDGIPQRGFSVRRFPTALTLVAELFGINRLWPGNPLNRAYRHLDLPDSKTFVEQPAGAFLMTRRDVFDDLGGLDERFWPVWFEDVDYCKRANDLGFRIAYIPTVTARHSGAHSVGKIPQGCRVRYWYASLLLYAAKHYGSIHYRGICLAAMLSTVPRAIVETVIRRSFEPLAAYANAFWVAGTRLVTRQETAAQREFNQQT